MTLPLQDKVIWITGVMGLIGQAAAANFLAKGARVIGTDVRDPGASPTIIALRSRYGERLEVLVSDAAEEDRVSEAVRQIRDRYGRLDGLFHAAYTQIWKPVMTATAAEWEAVLRGTLTSTFLVDKHACTLMRESGGGAIVNASSVLGHVVLPQSPAAYAAAKAGVNQLTRVAAAEFASMGVRVNAIVPGDIKAADHPDQHAENLIGRSGRPEEAAELAAFLLSDSAAYMTGSLYPIDGGFGL